LLLPIVGYVVSFRFPDLGKLLISYGINLLLLAAKQPKAKPDPDESPNPVTVDQPKLPPPMPLLMCLVLVGCAPSAGARAVTTMSDFVSKADPILRDAYVRELDACPDKACVEKVKAAWTPIIDTLQEVRKVWCELEPKAEGC
jgi:hypothetical protein